LPTPVVDEIADTAREAGLTVAMLPTLDELLRPLPHAPAIPSPRTADDDSVQPVGCQNSRRRLISGFRPLPRTR